MSSLQDQLLSAGLIDKKDAQKAKKQKRKDNNQARRSKEGVVDETKLQAEQARAAKQERDRKLNREREDAKQKKAIAAQIKQLITANAVDYRGEVEYNFTDGKKIKKIFISDDVQRQLTRGRLTIAKLGDQYYLIVSEVAERISERDDSYIVLANTKVEDDLDEDDPYKDYQIPDDLMW